MLETLLAYWPDRWESLESLLWLALALVVIAVIAWTFQRFLAKKEVMATTDDEDMLSVLTPSRLSRFVRVLPWLFVLLAVGAVLMPLVAKPVRISLEPYEEATLQTVVDSSHTSTAVDPSDPSSIPRIDRELFVLGQFVQVAPDDMAIGISKFDSNVVTVVPPTTDKAFLQGVLNEGIETGRWSYIGEALYENVSYLSTILDETDDGTIPARIVLFTDGFEDKLEDDTGSPSLEEAVAFAIDYGIKVYPVVFGHGDEVTYDKVGNPSRAPVDREAMQYVADQTGGALLATSSTEELANFFSETASSMGHQEVVVDAWELFPVIAVIFALVAGMIALFTRTQMFSVSKPTIETTSEEAIATRLLQAASANLV